MLRQRSPALVLLIFFLLLLLLLLLLLFKSWRQSPWCGW